MVPYFPKQVSYRAYITYAAALTIVSLLYFRYAMRFEFVLFGIVSVLCFFYFSSQWTVTSLKADKKAFVKELFLISLAIRVVWVVFSYYYYINATGQPFEYASADAIGYHEGAEWISQRSFSEIYQHYFGNVVGVSDLGYIFYLSLLYKLIGPNIIVARLIKAALSAFSVVLIYRLSVRTFGEETAKMAGIMTALMPNLIIYCGYHLKETEMLFLIVAFLERMDYLLRSTKIYFWDVLIPSLLAISMFFFRTVLGAAAIFSFASAILFSSAPTLKKGWRRAALIGWGVLGLLIVSGGTIVTEIEGFWEGRNESVLNKRAEQTIRGNRWAQYATGSVMAPMVVVLPFATMIDVDEQYGQQEKHGGNFIRNFMGFFAAIAIYEAFRRKKWRDFSLIGSFVIAYLGVVSLSGFSNSERFLLPGLPCLIMMWAYGISALRKQTYRFLNPWCYVVVLMEVAWAYFKLGSRGLF